MDVALVETGNGGDFRINGNDLLTIQGWGNMPYLALFGGNPEAVTKKKLSTEQNKDWWGNNLLMPQDQSIQFNSLTERALMEVPLTSSGRIRLEAIVKEDLAFMSAFADVSVSVTIESDDKVRILIKVRQPDNLEGRIADDYRAYIFIWDATQKMLGDFSAMDFSKEDFYV